MYSVVLIAALTAGSATPAWHSRGGCCGCCGGGCWGGCYGCFGGCFGGCYGGGYGHGLGAPTYPGSIVPDDGMIAPGIGDYGMIAPGTGDDGMMAPDTAVYRSGRGMPTGESLGTPTSEPLGMPTGTKGKDRNKNGQVMLASTNAKVVVELPANAKLYVNDVLVQAAAGVQTFHTPALEPGKAYFYLVRIEMMRDGQPLSETRRIIVRAGQVARADFKAWESETLRTAQAKEK